MMLLALALLAQQPADIPASKHAAIVAPACVWTASGPAHRESLVRIEAEGPARTEAVRALVSWAAVADLQFTITRMDAGLVIRTAEPGECGVPAMAGGWASDTVIGVREWTDERLFSILLHEIGHVLGLRHSDNRQSVMWFITREQRYADISEEDEQLVIARYGAAERDKWTVREYLGWNVWRYYGVGAVPKGATGRGWHWQLVCATGDCPQ